MTASDFRAHPLQFLLASRGPSTHAPAKAGDTVAAGEGIETMLALKSVLPALPMIAALSASHLAALDLSPAPGSDPAQALRRLYVARDNDAAGRKAAQRLRERGEALGIEVRDLMPVHGDFNTDLCRLGPAALLAHLMPQLARPMSLVSPAPRSV